MKLSLIVRGQHPPGDPAGHLKDDVALVCAEVESLSNPSNPSARR